MQLTKGHWSAAGRQIRSSRSVSAAAWRWKSTIRAPHASDGTPVSGIAQADGASVVPPLPTGSTPRAGAAFGRPATSRSWHEEAVADEAERAEERGA